MEGIHLIKALFQENHYFIKIDLKYPDFGITLNKQPRKYEPFKQEENFYEFLCLCVSLVPAPLIFTKILKIPIALLRRINVRIIIFLDDMLVSTSSICNGNKTCKGNIVFLLKN